MASVEDVPSNRESKECKYCNKSVEKSYVKCTNCKLVYHLSCASRITGLLVISGSRGLILCPSCEKNSRQIDVNKQIDAAIADKEMEIKDLKQKIAELETKTMLGNFMEVMKRMEIMEESLTNKVSALTIVGEKMAMDPAPPNGREQQRKKTDNRNKSDRAQSSSARETTTTNQAVQSVEILNREHLTRKGQNIDTTSTAFSPKNGSTSMAQQTDDNHLDANVKELSEVDVDNNGKTNQKSAGSIIEKETETDGNWKRVSYRKTKRPTKSNRPQPVQGCNNETNLKIAQRLAFLFVSGLASDVNEQDVVGYLNSQSLKLVECQKMRTKKEKYRSSFKLTVHYQDREKFLDPAVWPKQVVVNHFMNIQRLTVTTQKNQKINTPSK